MPKTKATVSAAIVRAVLVKISIRPGAVCPVGGAGGLGTCQLFWVLAVNGADACMFCNGMLEWACRGLDEDVV